MGHKKSTSSRVLIILLPLIALPEASLMADATTLTVGPGNSIQAAIFEAKPNDTIIVMSGEYYEHLKVDKSVRLKGVGWPVLDATASGSAITLTANGNTVEGFRIKNAGSLQDKKASEAGMKILSSGNTIEGNNVSNNFNGLLIKGGRNNTIMKNIVDGNLGFGIRLERAMNNTIANNSLEDNSENAFDNGANRWDNNRYSDYDLPEEGCRDRCDGICQKGYAVPGGLNVDNRPRIKKN